MATRFGATRQSRGIGSKLPLILGVLASMIVGLIGLIFYQVNSSNSGEINSNDPRAEVAPTVDIIVASSRIEEGAQITPTMITTLAVQPDLIPEGAFLARQQEELVGKYSTAMINAQGYILQSQISIERAVSGLTIPPGYRAVTVTLGSEEIVEGWAKPNSRVDVNWLYVEPGGDKKLRKIVRYVKILSVGGSNQAGAEGMPTQGGGNTVTLLLTENDAQRVEFAKNTGKISLTLVGITEVGTGEATSEEVNLKTMLGDPNTKSDEEVVDGKIESIDPVTGQRVTKVLVKGRWKILTKGEEAPAAE
jgi:Flp pilus assembly protein CpaB